MPSWLGRPALIVIAAVLLTLYWLPLRTDPNVVRAVAAANTATAAILLAWAVLDTDAGGGLRTVTGIVGVALIGLAVTQFRLSRVS
ncbi:MAG: hypothetical protein ABI275_01195 [Terrimesophilobacter sp.]